LPAWPGKAPPVSSKVRRQLEAREEPPIIEPGVGIDLDLVGDARRLCESVAMAGLEVVPFSDEHLKDAGRLLAARHARQREAEPLLREQFEEPAAAREELVGAWRTGDASGASAFRNGRLVGYLIGAPRNVEVWGANVWIEAAGHAVEDAEDVRDLYAAAAARWFEEERRATMRSCRRPTLSSWTRGFASASAISRRTGSERFLRTSMSASRTGSRSASPARRTSRH
jgi:hypothetical protein